MEAFVGDGIWGNPAPYSPGVRGHPVGDSREHVGEQVCVFVFLGARAAAALPLGPPPPPGPLILD